MNNLDVLLTILDEQHDYIMQAAKIKPNSHFNPNFIPNQYKTSEISNKCKYIYIYIYIYLQCITVYDKTANYYGYPHQASPRPKDINNNK